jgi:hypothetical protein
LAFAVAVVAQGDSNAQTIDRLARAKSDGQVVKILAELHPTDPETRELVRSVRKDPKPASSPTLKKLEDRLQEVNLIESAPLAPDAKSQAAKIKSSPLYRDDQADSANWLGKALKGLVAWLVKRLQFKPPTAPNAPPAILGRIFTYVIWGVLGIVAAIFLVFAVSHIRWRARLKRKATALLEEDEPVRTIDEWMDRAEEFEKQGKFREAVRCLYLACLLKFDEARIARFDRGQTNWEHLHRIEASPRLPSGLHFRAATQAFDQIWYGMRVNGVTDVQKFRAIHFEITQALMEQSV